VLLGDGFRVHIMPVFASYMGTTCQPDDNRIWVHVHSGNQGSYWVRVWTRRWLGSSGWGAWQMTHQRTGSSNVMYVGPAPHSWTLPDGYYQAWVQIWYPAGPTVANGPVRFYDNRRWSTVIRGWYSDPVQHYCMM
jgi:hypothetical protein